MANMKEKNKYELMVILNPSLPENVRVGLESKIVECLECAEGKVEKIDVWGKRRMSYSIGGFDEGYYIVYNFENFSSEIRNIEKSLKLNKEIIRFLLINKGKK